MKKYKFLVFVILLFFAALCIYGELEYSLAAEPSLVGTWIGSVKDIVSDKQGQLTIDITSDTDFYDTGLHYLEGTVMLTGFPSCFTQGLFSSEIGNGQWFQSSYTGLIVALGEGFSEASLHIEISSDLTQILISAAIIYDSSGNSCVYLQNDALTKQTTQYSDFSANPTTGPSPLTVIFTDESTGSITFWEWDFGDGLTSTTQNPSHTYTDPGTYTVTLTVTGPEGSDTETKPNYIKATSPAKAMPWIPLLLDD